MELQVTGSRNVKAHGFLSTESYSQILASADVAIGTLALHGKNMDEASPLKVREYFAYGIPTIIGYKDTDFAEPAPFLLRLPNTAANAQDSVQQIEYFVNTWKGQSVPREAILHLDVAGKEHQQLAFFDQIFELSSARH